MRELADDDVALGEGGLVIKGLRVGGAAADFARLADESGKDLKDVVEQMLQVGALVLQHGAQAALSDTVTTAIREELGSHARLNRVYEQTSTKGLDFEDQVGVVLAEFFAAHTDLLEATGATAGRDGRNKKGDFVATLDSVTVAGRDRKIVFEVKDRGRLQLGGDTGELAYLGKAMENRRAHVGVLVCSTEPRGLGPSPLRLYGNDKIVVVLDKQVSDALALKTACGLARSLAAHDGGEYVDADYPFVRDRVNRLQGTIYQAVAIREGLRTARSGLEAIQGAYDELDRNALRILGELDRHLGGRKTTG